MSAIAEKYGIDLTREHKAGCPRCIREGRDNSHDNLHVYASTESAFCHACGWTIPSKEYREAMGWEEDGLNEYEDEIVNTKTLLTAEENEQIKGYTGTKGFGSRGIEDEYYKAYGVRFKYSETTGEVVETYYPYTQDYQAAGYKIRVMNPKGFRSVGKIGKNSDLFGAWKWKQGGRTLVVCCGEADTIAAYAMLEEYRKGKGNNFEPTAVVSAGVGETGSFKQFQENYDWLASWEKIIYFPDNDEAGLAALENINNVMPKGKLFIAKLPEKDVNDMLVKGKQKQFIKAFFEAKPYTPTGVVGSSELFDAMLEASEVEKMPFPPAYKELNEMLAGGVALGTIGVISAFTGIAKTTIVNECLYHWIFNSPHKIAVVSMEQSKSQFGELMLSRHMGVKLGKMLPEQKREFLMRPETREASSVLFRAEDGSDRFLVVDDRDMEIESMKAAIEKAVISCNARVIIWDTISDALDALTVEEQAHVMKWCKSLVAMYNCSLILIAHQRKPPAGAKDGAKGGMGSESGVQGSSTITKSATWILMLARDKTNEDPVIRNTTYLELPKNRDASETGKAGELYYDSSTHTIHNKQEWMESNPAMF
jgi:KaiC/GvpD/RAD55 family RecA-like ATPase